MQGLQLSRSDLASALRFVEKGNDLDRIEEFPAYIISGLPRVVDCDAISYNEVNLERGTLVAAMEPANIRFPGDEQVFIANAASHPLLCYYQETGDGRAYKISDFLTQEEFHQLDLYKNLYSRMGLEYQIAFTLPAPPPLVIGIALSRSKKDFSERERQLLNTIRPHLVQIRRRIETQSQLVGTVADLQRATDAFGQGVVALSGSEGSIAFATPEAWRLVGKYFPESSSVTELPEEILTWLGQPETSSDDLERPGPSEALVIPRAANRLVVRHLPRFRADQHGILVLEEDATLLRPASLRPLPLTQREAEVLLTLAHGKSNVEIARYLGVTERTVQKHLEHIYEKLDVNNRAAAVALAFQTARALTPESRS